MLGGHECPQSPVGDPYARLVSQHTARVRVVQPLAGSLDPNAAMADALAAVAASGDVDLLLLPELATTRYDLRRHLAEVAPQPHDPALVRLQEAAAAAATVVIVGFAERDVQTSPGLHNSALVIEADGSIAGIVRKTHLFAGETRVFAPGSAISPVPTSIGLLGVAICFDIEFPEVARTLALAGADLLVVLSANMHPYARYHMTYARARAMENNLPLAVSNWVGEGPKFTFLGRSCIVTASGEIVADAGEEVGFATATVVLGRDSADADLDYLSLRRPEVY